MFRLCDYERYLKTKELPRVLEDQINKFLSDTRIEMRIASACMNSNGELKCLYIECSSIFKEYFGDFLHTDTALNAICQSISDKLAYMGGYYRVYTGGLYVPEYYGCPDMEEYRIILVPTKELDEFRPTCDSIFFDTIRKS